MPTTPTPQVVVVTGASGGIGRAIAHAFAKRGARVGLLARGRAGLDAAADEVRVARRRGARRADRRRRRRPRSRPRPAAVEQHFGPIDVWVNDAMATVFARFIDTQPDEFKRATEVTYLGVVYGTHGRAEAHARRATAARSCRSAPRSPTARSRCRPPTAAPNSRSAASPTRSAPNCSPTSSNVRITMVQLPGVNTTQFNWCRSKLPDHPRPVPPIYQPEIPAEAVYWAAQHHRRELWVGYSAVQAILGNKLAPYWPIATWPGPRSPGQQVDGMPIAGERPGNLFAPVEGKAATHGIFDAQAKTRSPQLWAATHRPAVAGALAAGALSILGVLRAMR